MELQAQHHAAIRMRIEGRSSEEIARELEVEKRTVYLWFSDPRIKAELADQVDRVNGGGPRRSGWWPRTPTWRVPRRRRAWPR